MTDLQLVTLSITLLAILLSTFLNRKSVEDMRDVLRAEIKAENAEMRTARAQDRAEFHLAIQGLNNKLDHLLDTMASFHERLSRLEGGKQT